MIDSHTQTYWRYEYDVSRNWMVPLLAGWGVALKGAAVLDVGCGEGGGVCALHDEGALCKGMDIDEKRIAVAQELREGRNISYASGDIFQSQPPFFDAEYDLLVLHDVFEHLDRKAEVLAKLRSILRPERGRILITFPPYYSAYGAHQQHLRASYGHLPFFHLLPFSMSRIVPRMRDEYPHVIEEVTKLGRLKMGMRAFERIAERAGMRIVGKQAYLISPNHIRFGLKPIPAGPVASVPVLGELLCTGVVYLIAPHG